MMLYFKAWAESRARFALAVLVLAASSVLVIMYGGARLTLFGGVVRTIFLLFAAILGLGGLLRERELGTAGFTLALPVTRLRLTSVRALAALVELAILAFVPVAILGIAAPFLPQSLRLDHAAMSALRWIVGGAAIFALAFLASAMLEGEYTAFVATIGVHFASTVTMQLVRIARPPTRPYLFTIQEVMDGTRNGPIPLAVVTAATIVLIATAIVWTEKRDF
jgi:ABC-type transport system involved in multi-copper enzyme maturation permease subunit